MHAQPTRRGGSRIKGSSGLLLGCLVLAVLFEPERVHATHEAVTGAVRWPRGDDPFDHVSQLQLVADEEGEVLGDFERQEIARLVQQGPLQEAGRSLPFAVRPRLDGEHMQDLALARCKAPGIEVAHEGPRPVEPRCRAGVQGQICLQDAGEDQLWIASRRLFGESRWVPTERDQLLDRLVQEVDRVLVARRRQGCPSGP